MTISTAGLSRRHRWLIRIGVLAAAAVTGSFAAWSPGDTVPGISTADPAQAKSATPPIHATLLFSRTEITAAKNCVSSDVGVARLDRVVAPWLASLGLTATGTLTTANTQESERTCVHERSSMAASWADAAALANRYGWSFVSHTATYPKNLAGLTPEQAWAETCGSAQAIDEHGLPGGHGLIAYPGLQPLPEAIQGTYGASCFAWGRRYVKPGVTTAADAATTAPYWQNTKNLGGGDCNLSTAPCFTAGTVGTRYQQPASLIATVKRLQPGQWYTLQAYVLVRGVGPADGNGGVRWDCTAADPRLHWTDDWERYCYNDWQKIVRAIVARGDVVVTDPLTVGAAYGRVPTQVPEPDAG